MIAGPVARTCPTAGNRAVPWRQDLRATRREPAVFEKKGKLKAVL